MNTDTIIWYTQVNNKQRKVWTNFLKYILDQAKKSIEEKNSEHPTGTLTTTFYKSAGEENSYVRFGYVPHIIFYHIRGQVSGSMNTDTINANK